MAVTTPSGIPDVSLHEIGEAQALERHHADFHRSLTTAFEGQDFSDLIVPLAPDQTVQMVTLRDVHLVLFHGLDGAVILSDGRVVRETRPFIGPRWRALLSLDTLPPPIRLDGPVVCTIDSGWWASWYHWLVLSLGRAELARDHLHGTRLVFPRHRPSPLGKFSFPVWRDALEAMKLPHEALADGVYRVSELRLPLVDVGDPTAVSFVPPFYRRFAQIGQEMRTGRTRKLLVLRLADPRLPADVTEAIRQLAVRYGFEVVHLEGTSFAEQVSMFADARHVVGAHGAGLSNIVFAAPGCEVLELNHEMDGNGRLRPHYCRLADGAGHSYRYLNGTRGDWTQGRLTEALARMGGLD